MRGCTPTCSTPRNRIPGSACFRAPTSPACRATASRCSVYWRAMRILALAVVALPCAAAAEPMQVGGWFGPRVYSTDSTLGYIDNAPQHPVLSDAVELGGRIGRSFYYPWLVPEAELAIAPT